MTTNTKINMSTINEQVLIIKTNADDATALVMEWANCGEAEIDDEGGIWISNPQAGHWLDDEKRARFVAWCEQQ